MKDANCRFSTLQIHLGHWGPVGIVLRLWILIFHGHFAKTLVRSILTLARPPTAVTEFRSAWGLLWAAREVLGSCGSFVTAVGRGGDLETALQMVLFQGTPVDTVGSEEVQTSECDDLCSAAPKPSCSLIQNQQEASFPHLSGSLVSQVAALQPGGVPCPLPGRQWDPSPPGPSPEVYQQISNE